MKSASSLGTYRMHHHGRLQIRVYNWIGDYYLIGGEDEMLLMLCAWTGWPHAGDGAGIVRQTSSQKRGSSAAEVDGTPDANVRRSTGEMVGGGRSDGRLTLRRPNLRLAGGVLLLLSAFMDGDDSSNNGVAKSFRRRIMEIGLGDIALLGPGELPR